MLNLYSKQTQNCSQSALKESNDVMDGDANPPAFVQRAEEIEGGFQWCEYFFTAVKIVSRVQTRESLSVLNWIFILRYQKVKGEETGTHEHFQTTKELIRFFSFVVVSGNCLTRATCPGLTEMQLFHAQLLKPQKDENRGGTSQFGTIYIGYITVVWLWFFVCFCVVVFFTRNVFW